MSEHELWNELGNLYFISGAYNQAAYAYNRSIQLDVHYGRPYSNLALTCVRLGKYDDAVELYRKSITLLSEEKEKAVSWSQLGTVYRYLKDYSQAILAFQRADELDPANDENREEPAHLLYGGSSWNDSDMLSLAKEVERFLQRSGGEAIPQFDGASPDALEEHKFSDNREQDPAGSELLPSTIEELSDPEQLSEASAESNVQAVRDMDETGFIQNWMEELIEEDPAYQPDSEDNNPDTNLVVSEGEFAFVTPPEAFPFENNAGENQSLPITNDSELVRFPFELSELSLSERGKPRGYESMESGQWIPSLREDPNFSDPAEPERKISIQSAVDVEENDQLPDYVLAGHGESNENPRKFSERVQVFPDEGLNHIPDAKEIEVGLARYKRVVQLNPNNAAAWDMLGSLYKSAGLYKDAALAYQQAISVDPSKSIYFHHLGLVYAADRREEDAIDAFQKVIDLEPGHGLAHAALGGYYRKMGLEDLAQKHIGKAMKIIYDSENEYNRACLEAICGNVDQALELLRVALDNKQTYVDWVLRDPDLDFIRNDPRFARLVREYS